MSKHSPVPFHTGGKNGQIVYDCNGLAIANCAVFHAGADAGRMEANAKLFAGSASLLEACEVAVATIERLQRHAPGSAKGTLDVLQADVAVVTVFDPSAISSRVTELNHQRLFDDYHNTLQKASRARQNREWLLQHAESQRLNLNLHASLFATGCRGLRKPADLEASLRDAANLRKHYERLQESHNFCRGVAYAVGELADSLSY